MQPFHRAVLDFAAAAAGDGPACAVLVMRTRRAMLRLT
jgi:hypothetical protein